MIRKLSKICFLLASLVAGVASANPYHLSYGGRLVESSGKPIAGPVTLRVSFFRSLTGNDQVTVAIPDYTGVALQEGIFQIALTLTPADFHTIFNGTDKAFIQIEDLTHSVAYPRQEFSAVPYALKVPVDGTSITYNTNGQLALGNGTNILSLPNSPGAVNKVLKSDGSGALVWSDDLTGGVGSITSSDIQDGSITNADIAAGAGISASKISGLGGAATLNVGTTAGTVAAGDHGHTNATGGAAGFMSAADKTKLDGIATGAGVDTDTNGKTLCADGEFLRGDDGATVCRTAGQIITDGSGVKTTDNGSVTGSMIANDTIANVDISTTAAIDGTKINAAFGSQTVSADTIKATNHLQTATSAGAPAGAECDNPAEYGRLKTDTTNNKLYVCSTSGWVLNTTGSGYLSAASNLGDVGNATTARNNLGLGAAATKAVGTGAADVAAGDHTHAAANSTTPGFMSAADNIRLNAAIVASDTGTVTSTIIANGTIVDADISNSAAIATSKISGPVTSIASHGLGSLATKNTVAAGDVDDGSISLAKLSATMCGANQVLKMNGAGTALTCATDATSSSSYAAKSADYTVTAADNEKLLDVTNQTTITLPAAATAGAGFKVVVKRSGSAFVRIMPNGAENIDAQNVGIILAAVNTSVTLLSSGSSWVIAGKDGTYVRSSAFSDLTCGGASDYCYDDATAMAAGYAVTPGGKSLEYVVTSSGFKVWKEIGGSRILKPTGSDNWAMKLNASGKGFSAVDFAAWSGITGRACPTNVYIDDSSKFTTGNCLYYTSEPYQTLNANGADDVNGINAWSTAKWYKGNVAVCSSKGMRLPTMFETSQNTSSYPGYPTADGNPTFALATGIPPTTTYTWTATTLTSDNNSYFVWSFSLGTSAYTSAAAVRCVLP